MVILDAYIELEQSGFTLHNEELIGHSILAQVGGNLFRNMVHDDWQIMYALHDISGNGQPELFIGAARSLSPQYASGFITGIYILLDGEPVSVIQLEDSRHSVNLFTDWYGRYIIAHGHGHMSFAWQYFYTLGSGRQ